MKHQAENTVSCLFYYMWNAWSREECKVVFGDMHRHFWNKWSALACGQVHIRCSGMVLCRVVGKLPETVCRACRYAL